MSKQIKISAGDLCRVKEDIIAYKTKYRGGILDTNRDNIDICQFHNEVIIERGSVVMFYYCWLSESICRNTTFYAELLCENQIYYIHKSYFYDPKDYLEKYYRKLS